jgi:predicted esterase
MLGTVNVRNALVLLALLLPSLLAAGPISGFEGTPDNPQTPGYHRLIYRYTGEDGGSRTTPFILYLPEGYGKKDGPWPLLVSLHGLGERGNDHKQILASAVLRMFSANVELEKWAPFAVLYPQCPADVRWETPSVGKMVAAMTRDVAAQWPIDPTRIYLSGASMGGSGCWSVVRADPSLFAAIAAIVGNEVEPEAVAAGLKGKGATCLVISGTHDPKSEPGSSHMVEALRKANVDTVQVKVPFGGHDLYRAYYGEKVFYEWLLAHRLGRQPPKDRLSADALLAMTVNLTKANEARYKQLNEELQTVAKWWQVDGCDLRRQPGLHAKSMGHTNIFITNPFTDQTKAYGVRYYPCRLQTTTTLPAAKSVHLRMCVGHFPTGSFKLEVRVNEQEHFSTVVDARCSEKNWAKIDVDLSKFAGQEVRLQVVQSNNGAPRDDAYWESVVIVAP